MKRVLGFMSGTSLDGVDAAVIETDGHSVGKLGPALLLPFDDAERELLVVATEESVAAGTVCLDSVLALAAAEVVLDVHVRAAEALRAAGGDFELVGFHGQTLLHRPAVGATFQVGDPAALASALGVPVVAHLRHADMAVGGQGAPLVPVYHRALAAMIGCALPVAFLNVGGVANLTFIGPDDQLIAFDTGPGNGLIDLMVQARGLGRYDDGGRYAAAGRVVDAALASLLEAEYLGRQGAKSLDRYDFALDAVDGLSIEDAAATLTAFTAAAVAMGASTLPTPPRQWIVCGGGRHNPEVMAALNARVGRCMSADEFGLRGDFVEAEAFAFLAARSVAGLPITFPGTTGVASPRSGGELFFPGKGNC